jgi:hypothetical protein
MNVINIASDILKNAIVETSVPEKQIAEAKEVASFCKEKLESLLSDINLSLAELNGDNEPSILSSKDDFKSLFLKLKNMKRRLSII